MSIPTRKHLGKRGGIVELKGDWLADKVPCILGASSGAAAEIRYKHVKTPLSYNARDEGHMWRYDG